MTYAEPQPPKPKHADADADANADANADEPPGGATAGRKRRLGEGAEPPASEQPSSASLGGQGCPASLAQSTPSTASASVGTAATASLASTPQLEGDGEGGLATSSKRHAGPTPVGPSAPLEAPAPVEASISRSISRSDAEDTPNVASYLADTPDAE